MVLKGASIDYGCAFTEKQELLLYFKLSQRTDQTDRSGCQPRTFALLGDAGSGVCGHLALFEGTGHSGIVYAVLHLLLHVYEFASSGCSVLTNSD
jgi:hypothetical protein